MITYKQQQEANERAAELKMTEVNDLLQIGEFFDRHNELVHCDAAVKIIMEYMADTEISAATLEDALTHTRLAQKLPRQTETENREKVESELLGLYEQSSPGTANDRQRRWKYQTVDQLRQELAGLVASRAARAKTPQQLRAEIAASRPGQEQELPDNISREQILHMWDPSMFRYWAQKVGMNAITKRINERRKDR
jgi:hypothetical protein